MIGRLFGKLLELVLSGNPQSRTVHLAAHHPASQATDDAGHQVFEIVEELLAELAQTLFVETFESDEKAIGLPFHPHRELETGERQKAAHGDRCRELGLSIRREERFQMTRGVRRRTRKTRCGTVLSGDLRLAGRRIDQSRRDRGDWRGRPG